MYLVNERYEASCQLKQMKIFVLHIKDKMKEGYNMQSEEVENIWNSVYSRKSVNHKIMDKRSVKIQVVVLL